MAIWDKPYAEVSWCATDVFQLARLEVADPDKLNAFLDRHEDSIQQAMIDAGGEKIRDLWYSEQHTRQP